MGRSCVILLTCVLFAVFSLTACTGTNSNSQSTSSASPGASPQATPGAPASAEATGAPQPSASGFPDSASLLTTGSDPDNWALPGKTYSGNRYTTMTDITPQNVATLKKAWVTQIADDGEQESSPIVWHGMIYIATSHDNVLALDAKTGAVRWAFPYNPAYVLAYAVNRGVGISDGKIFFGTQDCRIIALDATTGKQVWNVQGCRDTSNSWYSMAAYVYKDKVIMGTAGGDFGNTGIVSAFRTSDGSRLWDFNTVPHPGEPNFGTWKGDSWKHGGAAVWAGLSIDPDTDTLYISPGNPGPNLTLAGRGGRELYSDSVVALDIKGDKPAVKWYYQIVQKDTHDVDPAMPPTLFDGTINGQQRKLLAVGDKGGNFLIMDRTNGDVVHRMVVDKQQGLTMVPTVKGTFACPNHGGGIEWNGGSYDPASNNFIVPSTNECALWKIVTTGPVPYVAGQPYTAGPLPKRRPATGVVSAIDVNSGKVSWKKDLPYAGEGGVAITATGIAFTPDLRGRVYALDTKTGKELWHDDAGSSVVAPISLYRVDGQPYLVVLAGEGGNQHTPNLPPTQGSRLVAYALNAPQTAMNTTAGQPSPPAAPSSKTESGQTQASGGSIPYTTAQVASGKKLYGQYCSSCHGAKLQGISAPALTGASFAHSNLNVSQERTIVVSQMPLNAPGSLKPDQYASVMAYLLNYDCIAPSDNGKTPFPTSDTPALKKVVVGGSTCPAK